MTKFFWNALKLSPVFLSAILLLANRTQAAPVTVAELAPNSPNQEIAASAVAEQIAPEVKIAQLSQPVPTQQQVTDTPAQGAASQAQNTPTEDASGQVTSVSELATPEEDAALAQVTSVSQLSDVQPTDWAFQALQSLVERYGCIAGYPDGTYRGNRALTRYEFAAGLNACLDRVNELITAATANQVTREDLATLQRLQEEFSAELATLRGRVDALEARTAELESNQFSTTTKLTGEVIAAVSDVFSDERAVASNPAVAGGAVPGPAADDIDVNTVFADRVRLNFDTSFFGTDLLRTRLQARNIAPFNAARTGTNMTRLGFDGDEGNDVVIDDFFYRFRLAELAEVKIDFANSEFNDNVYTFNPFFESSGRGAISRFGRFNPIYRLGGEGAGLTLNLLPQGPLNVSLGYLAPRANNPSGGFGLLNGDYAAFGQIAFRPTPDISLGVTYAHTYDGVRDPNPDDPGNPNNVSLSGSTGSGFANSPFGAVATSANHYAVAASVRLGGRLTLSGWGGLTYATAEDSGAGVSRGDEANSVNWAATLALTDLVKEGSVFGVIFGQPPKVTSNDFGAGQDRTDADTSYHLEALYRFPLTDNIEITPGVLVIFNPEHNDNNDEIYVGTIRTTFRF